MDVHGIVTDRIKPYFILFTPCGGCVAESNKYLRVAVLKGILFMYKLFSETHFIALVGLKLAMYSRLA